LRPLAQRMTKAIGHARSVARIQFNEAARLQWHAVYPELSQGMPGLFGAVTSRAEAQVIRLAMIYALLDLCTEIQPKHLKAAIALWEYAEGSARYIFGSALGDPLADEIYRALRAAGPTGLTRTQIRDTFSRHKAGGSIQMALELLAKHRLAVMQTQTTPGRPAEVWIAI
jgi:hypothetical protein